MSKHLVIIALLFWYQSPDYNVQTSPIIQTINNSEIDIQFVGQHQFPKNFQFKNTEVGGLSGIDYDPKEKVYYAISDDRGDKRGPPRIYKLAIDLVDGKLNIGGVTILDMHVLRDISGKSLNHRVDPESIRLAEPSELSANSPLIWISEGDARYDILPSIYLSNRDGQTVERLTLPKKFQSSNNSGIQDNLGFESLALTKRQAPNFIFIATENGLKQDDDKATLAKGSKVRIVKMDISTKQYVAEYIYQTDPVIRPPIPKSGSADNGLVELLWLKKDTLLALERSYSQGVGISVRLYLAKLDSATDVNHIQTIKNLASPRLVKKELLLDLKELNIKIDNIEGMTWGPELSEKELLLILVSDNNFRDTQSTQFLSFRLTY